MSLTDTLPNYKPMYVEGEERSPRGKRMPDTREQFELMAELYDNALQREKEINSKLRSTVNNLRTKYETPKDTG